MHLSPIVTRSDQFEADVARFAGATVHLGQSPIDEPLVRQRQLQMYLAQLGTYPTESLQDPDGLAVVTFDDDIRRLRCPAESLEDRLRKSEMRGGGGVSNDGVGRGRGAGCRAIACWLPALLTMSAAPREVIGPS